MKVLFLTNIPSPYRVDFFNELGKKCELTVIFEGKYAKDRNSRWKADQERNFISIFLKGIRTSSDKFLCPGVIKVLSKKWDHIIVGGYSTPTGMLAIEYMRIRRIRFYIEADGGIIHKDSNFKFGVKKHFISSASAWFSSGDATTKYLIHYGAIAEKCFWYPFTSLKKSDLDEALMLTKVDKAEIKKKLEIGEQYIILSVGRFSYEGGYGKGYDCLLRVAENLSDEVGIYIVGDDPTEEFSNWKKNKNLDHVHFAGFKTKNELALYYATADIFVLMTKSDVWGLVINEAMMYSLPIITTNACIAGLELIQNGENGFIIDVGDAHALYEKIIYLIDNPKILHEQGKINLGLIRKYTIESMSDEHIRILGRNFHNSENSKG